MKKFIKLIFLINALFLIKINSFNYSYKTEIFSNLEKESFELPSIINNAIKELNSSLNLSFFFDTSFLLDTKNVKKYLLKPKFYTQDNAQIIKVTTEDKKTIECAYFDRNSNNLLVVGGGFTNEKELMAPFLHMFPNYDIVIFDYRGHGLKESKFYNPLSWQLNPINFMFNVKASETKLGAEEEKDVIAVVNNFKKFKKYEAVFGLGICYSALIFIKAQSIWQKNAHENLFDKIVIDGCWLSLNNFVKKLSLDLKLLCSPQYGGWKEKWPNNKEWFQIFFIGLAKKIFTLDFDKVSILPYLDAINIPILYFYGKNDLVVSREEFETIWEGLNTEKTAIITSNPHVRNHIKEKELYKHLAESFFELNHQSFIDCLKNKEILIDFYVKKIGDI